MSRIASYRRPERPDQLDVREYGLPSRFGTLRPVAKATARRALKRSDRDQLRRQRDKFDGWN